MLKPNDEVEFFLSNSHATTNTQRSARNLTRLLLWKKRHLVELVELLHDWLLKIHLVRSLIQPVLQTDLILSHDALWLRLLELQHLLLLRLI